ncbi:MAG: hypothetical protein HY207_05705 [Nitrospirae bacterium]|nr:hypothetical protein [Nitrospirota bacterium]
MARPFVLPGVLVALIAGHLLVAVQLQSQRVAMAQEREELGFLPPAAIRLLALDYRDLVADLIFSRTLSFHGGVLKRGEKIDARTWQAIYRRIDAASELDPYFVDPYYFGQAVLTWDAHMPREANALLDRGRRFRPDDWVMPFFMGFNAFYFLHDKTQGAAYLMEASRRPGSSPLVGLLAARLSSESRGTETAIGFLQELEAQTDDPGTKEEMKKRIGALRGIWVLEQAVEVYRDRFGSFPADLRELVKQGVLFAFPSDPYGGVFYLNDQGKVWTTSDLRPIKR